MNTNNTILLLATSSQPTDGTPTGSITTSVGKLYSEYCYHIGYYISKSRVFVHPSSYVWIIGSPLRKPLRKSKDDDCPDGTPATFIGYDPSVNRLKFEIYTCLCEDHCTWESCRLYDVPDECLVGTNSTWFWDSIKLTWVAKLSPGIIN